MNLPLSESPLPVCEKEEAYAPVDLDRLHQAFDGFRKALPFHHCIVDDFIAGDLAATLEKEFPAYESPRWFHYKNPIEDKKALNDWNLFPPATYSFFSYMNSPEFVDGLASMLGTKLYADPGLHGGGWHMHEAGGNLNPHLDYSIHPKIGLQRKLNIIIYLTRDLQENHGGHLGLWTHDQNENQPRSLAKEIQPLFNRAVIFDTTQNSWHGMSRRLTPPADIFRKSLAIYYLCDPPENVDRRGRALFAPRDNQRNDPAIEEIIKLRSGVSTSGKVYRV